MEVLGNILQMKYLLISRFLYNLGQFIMLRLKRNNCLRIWFIKIHYKMKKNKKNHKIKKVQLKAKEKELIH